jgi:hypothetical protein
MQPTTNKDAALSLVSLGLRIFPCTPEKTPLVTGWEHAASSSPFAVSVRWDATPEALAGYSGRCSWAGGDRLRP